MLHKAKIHFFTHPVDDFPALWNYDKLSAKFLVSSVKVIDTMGIFIEILLKGELQCQNKLISSRRPFKILQNETKIIKIG